MERRTLIQDDAWLGTVFPTRYYAEIRDCKLFDVPVPIKPLITKLSFIKEKFRWGVHFQGGTVRIPYTDYELILAEAKRLRSTHK